MKDITLIIEAVADSSESDFYRSRWGSERDFEKLPSISRADLLATPLSKRRYKDQRSLVKIVHTPDGSFLSEWSFDDIGKEPWGEIGVRPIVFLQDPHEAVEKSMWCYENNRVPLIGEKDPDLTMFAADKYKIDSLVTDAASLKLFAPYFKTHEPLDYLIVLGASMEEFREALPFAAHAKNAHAILRLSETGAIATAPLLEPFRFATVEDSIIEKSEKGLVVTKKTMLTTPVIRYQTGISGVELV